nr:MAG: hypothetical protein [Molluscum contagiosum virus]
MLAYLFQQWRHVTVASDLVSRDEPVVVRGRDWLSSRQVLREDLAHALQRKCGQDSEGLHGVNKRGSQACHIKIQFCSSPAP